MSAPKTLFARVMAWLAAHPEQYVTGLELAQSLIEADPEHFERKRQKSRKRYTDQELVAQVASEIGAHLLSWKGLPPEFRVTEGERPRRYYWTELSSDEEVREAEATSHAHIEEEVDATGLSSSIPHDNDLAAQEDGAHGPAAQQTRPLSGEKALYPLLKRYLRDTHHLSVRRIEESRSSNKFGSGSNKWLYPDLIALEDLGRGLHPDVRTALRESRSHTLRFWSFEVKVLLNRSNVREAYYQAVSNSSWAHLGYLVASKLEGRDTLFELRMLYAMHGIGVILLDPENPSESQILIPAREKADITWGMCSRLAEENPDFRDAMKDAWRFFRTSELHLKPSRDEG